MNRRLRLGRLFGLEIRVDWSWIITFVLAVWTLVSLNRRLMPDATTVLVTAMSTAAAAGLFASLGAHELVRVRAARSAGVPIRRLTLFVLGGLTDVERPPASPRTEARGALTAPAASLAIAVVLALGVTIASAPLPRSLHDLDRLGPMGVVLLEIAAANAAIAAVNLLPAYPLDGGRLLRALLWWKRGHLDQATRLAAWCGQVVGWALVLLGIAITLGSPRASVGVSLGMWTAFVGWFITSASAQSYEGVLSQRRV